MFNTDMFAICLLWLASVNRCGTYISVTSLRAQWRLKSLAYRSFTQPFVLAQKENSVPSHWSLLRGIHRWLVNSLHKGPVMWKMFIIRWCHHIFQIFRKTGPRIGEHTNDVSCEWNIYWHGLTGIRTWINFYIHEFMLDAIAHLYLAISC